MSDADPKDKAREEAREFLVAFLQGLQALDQTNRAQIQQSQTQIQQSQVLIGQLNLISTQLDGVAQRMDLLAGQIAGLSAVLSADAVMLPEVPPGRRGQGRGGAVPSIGQALGGVLGLGVDRFMGGNGQRRTR